MNRAPNHLCSSQTIFSPSHPFYTHVLSFPLSFNFQTSFSPTHPLQWYHFSSSPLPIFFFFTTLTSLLLLPLIPHSYHGWPLETASLHNSLPSSLPLLRLVHGPSLLPSAFSIIPHPSYHRWPLKAMQNTHTLAATPPPHPRSYQPS